ncbi:MAG: delta-60 repeat domain-containing protein, partial [Parafilimonas sp.]
MKLTLTFLSCFLYSILFSQVEYPDNSFGDHGTVITHFTYGAEISAITMQEDLKIIAVGQNGNYFVIARYNSDGTLDASFGFDGAVKTLVPGFVPSPSAVAVQKDGKIIVAGSASSFNSIAFVARFLPDGTPDPSFGTYGVLLPTIAAVSYGISGMVLQDDQKILVCGQSKVSASAPSSFSAFRLNPDGTSDASFGVNGAVFIDFKP